MPFKVPLSSKFDTQVPIENRFSMQMLLDSISKTFGARIGFVIDLTNTDRFYDCESEVKAKGVKYFKMKCRGYNSFCFIVLSYYCFLHLGINKKNIKIEIINKKDTAKHRPSSMRASSSI